MRKDLASNNNDKASDVPKPVKDLDKMRKAISILEDLHGEHDPRVVESKKELHDIESEFKAARPLGEQARDLEREQKEAQDRLSRDEKKVQKALAAVDDAKKVLREGELAVEERKHELASVRGKLEKVRENIRLERESTMRKEALEAEIAKRTGPESDFVPTPFAVWAASRYPSWSERGAGWPQHLKTAFEENCAHEYSIEMGQLQAQHATLAARIASERTLSSTAPKVESDKHPADADWDRALAASNDAPIAAKDRPDLSQSYGLSTQADPLGGMPVGHTALAATQPHAPSTPRCLLPNPAPLAEPGAFLPSSLYSSDDDMDSDMLDASEAEALAQQSCAMFYPGKELRDLEPPAKKRLMEFAYGVIRTRTA